MAQGQQGSGSPYSAHGLGDLTGASQVSQTGMGGTGIVICDPYSVARANPASYIALGHTVFEAGLGVRSTTFESEASTSKGRNTRMLGISLGVPFGRGKWGMALGIQPYSTVAYKLTDHVVTDGTNVTYQYTGSGGLNRAYWGFGRALWSRNDTLNRQGKLSVGANLEYLFGTVEASRKAYYPISSGFYNNSVVSRLVLRAPTATLGLQYSGDLIGLPNARKRMRARRERMLAKDQHAEMEWLNAGRDPKDRKAATMPKGEAGALRFRLGLSVELPTNLEAKHTSVAGSFLLSSSGVEFPRDTAAFIDGATGRLDLPMGLGGGFAVYNNRWTLAVEMQQRDWSALQADVEGYAVRTDLRPSTTYAFGASYRPAGDLGGGFLRRTIYRAGLRYTQEPIAVRGTAITQMGASLGLSLPLMGASTRSRLNISSEMGQRGTTTSGLILERYVNFFVGITITPDLREQWFKKRRIE